MKKYLLPIVILFAAAACKKSSPPPDNSCKITPATIAGTYIKVGIMYKASSTATPEDLFSFLQDCEKDDLYELNTDSSVVISNGPTTCPGPPPPGGISNWYLTSNNTRLVFGADMKIDSFVDCKRLVVTENDFFTPGDSKTTTYVKQ